MGASLAFMVCGRKRLKVRQAPFEAVTRSGAVDLTERTPFNSGCSSQAASQVRKFGVFGFSEGLPRSLSPFLFEPASDDVRKTPGLERRGKK
jgi:hypothetical protein